MLQNTTSDFQKKLYKIICFDYAIFNFIQNHSEDGLLIWEPENPSQLQIDEKLQQTLGFNDDEVLLEAIVHDDDLPSFQNNLRTQILDDGEKEFKIRLRHLGEAVIICRNTYHENESEKAIKIVAFVRLLEKNNNETGNFERYTDFKKSFIEKSAGITAMLDKDMGILAVSGSWIKRFHHSDENIIGKNFYDIFPAASVDRKKLHKEGLQGKTVKVNENLFIRQDGTELWLNWAIRPWFNIHGKIGGIIMEVSDITRIKKLEQLHREREKFLEAILENINVGIVSCDQTGKLTLFNKATKEWHGLSAIDIPQENFADYYGLYKTDGITHLEAAEIPLFMALNNGSVTNNEVLIKSKKGENRIVSATGSQLLDDSQNVIGAVVAMHDITKFKKGQEKLIASETIFRHTFDNAGTGMVMLDMNGKWVRYNDSFLEISGYKAEELENVHFNDLAHPEEREDNLRLFIEGVEGKRKYFTAEKRTLHKNGHYIPVLISGAIINDDKNQPLYSVTQIIDITLQKRAEKGLRNTIAKMDAILRASTQTILIGADTNGLINFFNKGAENLLGYSNEEVINKETPGLFHEKQELLELAEKVSRSTGKEFKNFDLFAELTKNDSDNTREWTFIRKDGSEFPVQLTITSIRENNAIIGYLGVGIDISGLKKAANELKSILKVTSGQNGRLKNFAHIVSHNLRSHSGNLTMLLDLFVQENPEAEEDELIIHLKTASKNLEETIDHLNEVVLMNTADDINLKKLNLYNYIELAKENVSGLAKNKEVEIENMVPRDTEILGVPAYLDSIVLNFLTNGIKYRSEQRDSYIKLKLEKHQEYLILKIMDNGLGIDLNKHRSKIFGMYKTFHPNKDSRGIGLFITKNQVEAMGGKIEVDSEVNKGTTFKIYFKYE